MTHTFNNYLYFIFNTLSNRFITFSGHFIAFGDRNSFAAETE